MFVTTRMPVCPADATSTQEDGARYAVYRTILGKPVQRVSYLFPSVETARGGFLASTRSTDWTWWQRSGHAVFRADNGVTESMPSALVKIA